MRVHRYITRSLIILNNYHTPIADLFTHVGILEIWVY